MPCSCSMQNKVLSTMALMLCNKAPNFTLCFISILATYIALRITQCFNIYKILYFQIYTYNRVWPSCVDQDNKPPWVIKEGFPKSLTIWSCEVWNTWLSFADFFYSNTYHNWLWVQFSIESHRHSLIYIVYNNLWPIMQLWCVSDQCYCVCAHMKHLLL